MILTRFFGRVRLAPSVTACRELVSRKEEKMLYRVSIRIIFPYSLLAAGKLEVYVSSTPGVSKQ